MTEMQYQVFLLFDVTRISNPFYDKNFVSEDFLQTTAETAFFFLFYAFLVKGDKHATFTYVIIIRGSQLSHNNF